MSGVRSPSQRVLDDIAVERARQMAVEGYTSAHDDRHGTGQIAEAAACLARHAARTPERRHAMRRGLPPSSWPWDGRHWKPTDPRRELVQAGALIVAEIERIDRRDGREVVAYWFPDRPGPDDRYEDLEDLFDGEVEHWLPVAVMRTGWTAPQWVVRVPVGNDAGELEGEEHWFFPTEADARATCDSAKAGDADPAAYPAGAGTSLAAVAAAMPHVAAIAAITALLQPCLRLPLRASEISAGTVHDADGREVLVVDHNSQHSHAEAYTVASAIVLAVNTCGGFGAEVAS